MTIKQQLAVVYDKQGLTGKHRRKAQQWDMRQVRKEVARRNGLLNSIYQLAKPPLPDCLMSLHWGSMTEPHQHYWAKRDLGYL